MTLLGSTIDFVASKSWRLQGLLNYTAEIRVEGRHIRVPIRGRLGRLHLSTFDRDIFNVIRLARSLDARGHVVVDVGANLGQTLVASAAANVPRYRGFEPDLDAAAYVRALIRANKFADASILPVALSDRNATETLRTGPNPAFVGATLDRRMMPAAMYASTVLVKTVTGDSELAEFGPGEIALVKIDVEGHEESVLRGMRDTILRARCMIYCEVLGYDHFVDGTYGRDYFGDLSRAQIEQLCSARERNGHRVAALFGELGYQLFEVDSSGRPTRLDTIPLSDPRPGKQGERNVLAVPLELAARL